jgi:peptidoglycan/LPS O-acetylase OafA/YrhL
MVPAGIKQGKEVLALTGLRFFAAASIFLAHFAENGRYSLGASLFGIPLSLASLAALGMPLFFTLSGFVIHYRYSREFAARADHLGTTAAFFSARFARLAPLYLFFFFVYLYAQGWLGQFFRGGHLFEFIALNLTPIYSWLPVWYHHDLQVQAFFGPSWSISTEVFFYVCYPLYATLLWKIRGFREVVQIAAVFCAAVVLWLGLVFATAGTWQGWASGVLPGYVSSKEDFDNSFYRWFVYVSPYTRMFEFVAGALAAQAFFVLKGRTISSREQRVGARLLAGTVAGIGGIYLALQWSQSAASAPELVKDLFAFFALNFLFAMPIAVLLFGCARYKGAPIARFLAWGVIVYLGEISYSLYLAHPFASQLVDEFVQTPDRWWFPYALVVLKTLVTIAIASLTYVFIEVPARKGLRGWLGALVSRPMGVRVALIACTLPIVVGAMLAQKDYAFARALTPSVISSMTENAIPKNLVWPSEHLQGGTWSGAEGARVVSGVAAPPGRRGDVLIADKSTGLHRIILIVPNVVAGSVIDFSIYVKSFGYRSLRLEMADSKIETYGVAIFDLDRALVLAHQGDIVEPLATRTEGWIRISGAILCTTDKALVTLSLVNGQGTHYFQGDGKSGLLFWGAQLTPGANVLRYVSTLDAPRL